MAKFTILHAVNGNFFAEEIPIEAYKRIADIECDSLDDVFRLSQNLTSNGWIAHKIVTPFEGIPQARSTSVGDLIYEDASDSYFMVENIGFSRVKIQDNQIVKVEIVQ